MIILERKTDIMEPHNERRINDRLTVLEFKADTHTAQQEEIKNSVDNLVCKLNTHTSEEIARDVKFESVMDNHSVALTTLNKTMENTNQSLSNLQLGVSGIKTIYKTVAVISSIVAALIAGGWTLFDFNTNHSDLTSMKAPK